MTLSLLTIPQMILIAPVSRFCKSTLLNLISLPLPIFANFPVAGNIRPGPVINQMQMLDLTKEPLLLPSFLDELDEAHTQFQTQLKI
jgi:hypothetical protein